MNISNDFLSDMEGMHATYLRSQRREKTLEHDGQFSFRSNFRRLLGVTVVLTRRCLEYSECLGFRSEVVVRLEMGSSCSERYVPWTTGH